MTPHYYIGIMSGTSLDGIDVALVDIQDQTITLVAASETPFEAELRSQLLLLCQEPTVHLEQLGTLSVKLSLAYAQAVNQLLDNTQLRPSDIHAIGCHGQTIYHQPEGAWPFSMQLINSSVLASHCHITTVSDFRSMDIALGGQGAPLVPPFHQQLCRHLIAENPSLVLLNIGGIANVSILKPTPLRGFDTGPGNVLMDSFLQQQNGLLFDDAGRIAASGSVNHSLLARFLSDEYFAITGPKSTGREYFNLDWLNTILAQFDTQPISDVLATLSVFVAQTIATALHSLPPGLLLVCGGGAKNTHLFNNLAQALPLWRIDTTNKHGIDADSMEAMAFAWLAKQCIERKAGNAPDVTGAHQAEILGQITQVYSHQPTSIGKETR